MMVPNKKIEKIVGDSKGKEAALNIHEWLQKNITYGYYKDGNKTLEQILKEERRDALNCTDCEFTEEDYRNRKRMIRKLQGLEEMEE